MFDVCPYCHCSNAHHAPGCPNDDEETIIGICSDCGEDVTSCQSRVVINSDLYHLKCLEKKGVAGFIEDILNIEIDY